VVDTVVAKCPQARGAKIKVIDRTCVANIWCHYRSGAKIHPMNNVESIDLYIRCLHFIASKQKARFHFWKRALFKYRDTA
jgi:hypothetical protein